MLRAGIVRLFDRFVRIGAGCLLCVVMKRMRMFERPVSCSAKQFRISRPGCATRIWIRQPYQRSDRAAHLVDDLSDDAEAALSGPESGAALATVVGVFVDLPVMLSVCRVASRHGTGPE